MDDVRLEAVHQAMQRLSGRQREFVLAWTTDPRCVGSASRSYAKAYGAGRAAARANGARLLRNPRVWAAIVALHAAADHEVAALGRPTC